MAKTKRIMDRVTVQIKNGSLIVLDIVPCPSCCNSACLHKAIDYYGKLYPNDYVDVQCNNPY